MNPLRKAKSEAKREYITHRLMRGAPPILWVDPLGLVDYKGFGLDLPALLCYGSTDEPSEYVLDQNRHSGRRVYPNLDPNGYF